MKKQASSDLLQAIAVCCELTNTQLSQAAVRVMSDDLAQYPEQQVMGALHRCRREVRSHLTIADIVARLDDGRPGPEEAWAICAPTLDDEGPTVVRTAEMDVAFGVALGCAHDKVAARMAFLESYRAQCMAARSEHRPVRWQPSLGHDASGREGVLLSAVAQGKLAADHVRALLPYMSPIDPQAERILALRKPAKLLASGHD